MKALSLRGGYDGGIIDSESSVNVKIDNGEGSILRNRGDIDFILEEGTDRETVFAFNKDGSFVIDDYNSRWVNSGTLRVGADGSYSRWTNGMGTSSLTQRGTDYGGDGDIALREGTRDRSKGWGSVSLPVVAIFDQSAVDGSDVYSAQENVDGSQDRSVVVEGENGPARLNIHCPDPNEKSFSNWWSGEADLVEMDGTDIPDPSMSDAMEMETTALADMNVRLEGSGAKDIPVEGERASFCALPKPTADRFGF